MRSIRALLRRLRTSFGRAPDDRELEQELEAHLQLHIADNLKAGMTADEARRQALVRLGAVESVKEAYRDRRSIPLLETTLQDARYALRTLRRNPGATLLGVFVMAIGIGANTAVFSVVHAVLLNPLPYSEPQRIVTLSYLSSGDASSSERSRQVSLPDFRDWQRDSTSFDAMTYYTVSPTSVIAGAAADYAVVATVTEDFLRVFAAQPAIGRPFTHDEAKEGGAGAALVSDRYARQNFGEPGRALGRTLQLFTRSVPIVGVLPPWFDFPVTTDVWFPAVVARPQATRRGNNFRALARLKGYVSLDRSQAEMTGISERLAAQFPETNKNVRVFVTPLQQEMVGDVQSLLYLLLAAVALVLLVACATMATLLLAKATARRPEIAVRAALGASRSRIVKQLLVEASVQALAAGTIGVTIAIWGTRVLVAFSPPGVPRLNEASVNASVLLFTLLLCVVVSLLFGLPPAMQASRVDVNEPLRNSARIAGGRPSRTREVIVIAEIALAVVLVSTSALLVRTLIALQLTPLGFQSDRVLLVQATLRPRVPDWSDSRAFFEGLLADVRQLPGVLAAGAMMGPPGRISSDSGYWVDRMPKEMPLTQIHPALMNVIAPGTFAALGMSVRAGRDFDTNDRPARPQVVIINEALARASFRDRDPIGRVIIAGFDSTAPMTIVGVVSDIRQNGPGLEPQPEVYMPYQQHVYNGATLHLVVKSAIDPAVLAPSVQRKARERSPEASVRPTTLDAVMAEHMATPKFRAWLLSLFGGTALCLAMAGVYGVMAFVAGQRAKEIGVRMALGASARSILWLMLSRGVTLSAIGLSAGVAGAIASTRLIAGMLYDVKPYDPVTFAGVVAGLGLLSLLATYVPARRAALVDPLTVLRQE